MLWFPLPFMVLVLHRIQTLNGIEVCAEWQKIIHAACSKNDLYLGSAPFCVLDPRQVIRDPQNELLFQFCPRIMLWDPLNQLSFAPMLPVLCPDHFERQSSTTQWMDGSSNSRQPRILWDTNGFLLLVSREYECPGTISEPSHRLRTTDVRLLELPDQGNCDVFFSRKFAYTKSLLSSLCDLLLDGVSFNQMHLFMQQRLQDFFAQALIKFRSNKNLEQRNITSTIDDLQGMFQSFVPDEETLKRVFNNWCSTNRNKWNQAMIKKPAKAMMADHTFKVTFNIGIHRDEDKKWMKIFNSLFIVMNENKEVVSWQLTKRENFDTIATLLENLKNRENTKPEFFVIDNCCKWERKIKEVMGNDVKVKLDLFHAVQRLTSTLDKGHKYHSRFCETLRTVFREVGDNEKSRKKPTPAPHVIEERLTKVINNWQSLEAILDCNTLLNAKFKLAFGNLIKHIKKGCLSHIPPGHSTGMNENLHKNLNKIFKGLKMGPELAMNLLSLFFFVWNCKILCKTSKKIYKSLVYIDEEPTPHSSEQFGIGLCRPSSSSSASPSDMIHQKNNSPNHNQAFISKCKLYKRLKCLSWLETIEVEFFFFDKINDNLLRMPRIKNARNEERSKINMEKRCKNFGFLVNRPIPNANESSIFMALSLTITEFFIEHENFSRVVQYYNSLGLSNGLCRNFDVLSFLIKEKFNDIYKATTKEGKSDQRLEFLNSNGYNIPTVGFFDMVVRAAADILGITIVIFTSLDNIPVIPIFSKHPQFTDMWLYVGLNFSENIEFFSLKKDVTTRSAATTATEKKNCQRKPCTCGSKGPMPELAKCTRAIHESGQAKYACRCPCFKAESPCTNLCSCRCCGNPFGLKDPVLSVDNESPPKRKRSRAATHLRPTRVKGTEYLRSQGESSAAGQWTDEETFLLRTLIPVDNEQQIVKRFNNVVNSCGMQFPSLREKSLNQVRAKCRFVKEHMNFVMAKATLTAQEIIGVTET